MALKGPDSIAPGTARGRGVKCICGLKGRDSGAVSGFQPSIQNRTLPGALLRCAPGYAVRPFQGQYKPDTTLPHFGTHNETTFATSAARPAKDLRAMKRRFRIA